MVARKRGPVAWQGPPNPASGMEVAGFWVSMLQNCLHAPKAHVRDRTAPPTPKTKRRRRRKVAELKGQQPNAETWALLGPPVEREPSQPKQGREPKLRCPGARSFSLARWNRQRLLWSNQLHLWVQVWSSIEPLIHEVGLPKMDPRTVRNKNKNKNNFNKQLTTSSTLFRGAFSETPSDHPPPPFCPFWPAPLAALLPRAAGGGRAGIDGHRKRSPTNDPGPPFA